MKNSHSVPFSCQSTAKEMPRIPTTGGQTTPFAIGALLEPYVNRRVGYRYAPIAKRLKDLQSDAGRDGTYQQFQPVQNLAVFGNSIAGGRENLLRIALLTAREAVEMYTKRPNFIVLLLG